MKKKLDDIRLPGSSERTRAKSIIKHATKPLPCENISCYENVNGYCCYLTVGNAHQCIAYKGDLEADDKLRRKGAWDQYA